ncbi:hypothetical protein YTPLAS72_12660 [Nitrospira sp.]|nr:hypothetical protein YTPLAS72_12660 [Nitrospira sp.]
MDTVGSDPNLTGIPEAGCPSRQGWFVEIPDGDMFRHADVNTDRRCIGIDRVSRNSSLVH